MNDPMKKKSPKIPKFKNESEEADWWASPAGRAHAKRNSASARAKGIKARGSSLVSKLKTKSSAQIALRLPVADLAQAREIAERRALAIRHYSRCSRPGFYRGES